MEACTRFCATTLAAREPRDPLGYVYLSLKYASCHWGTRARRETTERVQMLASNLLDGYGEHISSKIALWREMSMGFTKPSSAAYFGCVDNRCFNLLEMEK